MANASNSEFAGFSGKFGNIIFRNRNGKTIAYRVTENFKQSESEASKANRGKWKIMSQFASNIYSLPELKQIWELDEETKAASAYLKIEKRNRREKTSTQPTVNNVIVPSGFLCDTNSVKLNKDEIEIIVSLDKLSLKDVTKADNFIMIAIICFYDPVKKDAAEFSFYNIYKVITGWKLWEPITAQYKFSEEEGKIFGEYKKSILYYTLIACDAEGVYLGNSKNASIEFEF